MIRYLRAFGAALALLAVTLAPPVGLAQVPTNAPNSTGRLGPIVTGADLNGNSGRFVMPGQTLYDATGAPVGTASNPLITTSAGTSGSATGAKGATAPANAAQEGCAYTSPQVAVASGQLAGVQCDSYGNQLIAPLSITNTYTTLTIAAGGTAQDALAANSARRLWCVQAGSTNATVSRVNEGANATSTLGMEIAAGQQACNKADTIGVARISVWNATTGATFNVTSGQ